MPIVVTYICEHCGTKATGDDPPATWTVARGNVLCDTPRCLDHRAALEAHDRNLLVAKRKAAADAEAGKAARIAAAVAEWEAANPRPVLAEETGPSR